MPNETTTNPRDGFTPPAEQDTVDQDVFDEPSTGDSGQAEASLEDFSKAPALEEDEDSLVRPENS